MMVPNKAVAVAGVALIMFVVVVLGAVVGLVVVVLDAILLLLMAAVVDITVGLAEAVISVLVVVTFGSIPVVEPHSVAVIACMAILSNENPSSPNFPNMLPFQGVRLLPLPTLCTSASE